MKMISSKASFVNQRSSQSLLSYRVSNLIWHKYIQSLVNMKMMVNMTHIQYHLRVPQIVFSCKIFQSALHVDWGIMLTNKSGRLVPIMPLRSMKIWTIYM